MNIKICGYYHSSLFLHDCDIFVINIMNTDYQIPEPFLFNPVKHHLGFMKDIINLYVDNSLTDIQSLTKDIKHIGRSVMDIYTGSLSIRRIFIETEEYLKLNNIIERKSYSEWAGMKTDCYRIISLSDGSRWTLKYHNNPLRFVHIFPARNGQHTFRVKANTLKSALVYNIIIGKDMVTGDDLNKIRPLLGLSPVKDSIDTEAILEMIEILRG